MNNILSTNGVVSNTLKNANSWEWWQLIIIIFSITICVILILFAFAKSKRNLSYNKEKGWSLSGNNNDDQDCMSVSQNTLNNIFEIFDTCYNLKYIIAVNKQKKYAKDQLLIFRGKVERKFNELLQSFDKYKESLSPSTSFEFLRFKSCYQIFELLLEDDLEENFRENNFKSYSQEDFQNKIEGRISKYFEFYASSINSNFIFENQIASIISSEDVLKMFRLHFYDKQNSTEKVSKDDFIKLIYDIYNRAKQISIETYKTIEEIKTKNIKGYLNNDNKTENNKKN